MALRRTAGEHHRPFARPAHLSRLRFGTLLDTMEVSHMRFGTLLTPTLLVLALPGQGSIVTPVQYAAAAGPSSYTGAWHSTDRSQQIHGDLRNQVLALKSIAWRRSAYPVADPSSFSRTIDAEFFAGEGDMNAAGVTFLANYQGPRTSVVARKPMSLPDWSQFQGSPAQFTFVVPFDQPFSYSGASDLVWEVIVWSNTGNSNYLADACAGILSLPGTVQYVGSGCLATGRTLPVVETVSIDAMRNPDRLLLEAICSNVPVASPTALLIGATDPNLSVPGLCAAVRTDALIGILGTSSAFGQLAIGPLSFAHQGSLVGQKLWMQFISNDAGQQIPYVLSNGASVEVPALPPPLPLVKLVRAAQQPWSTTGAVVPFLGQIVRFGT